MRPFVCLLFAAMLCISQPALADQGQWKPVWEDSFDRPEVGHEWHVVGGKASIQNGRLLLEGGGATILSERTFKPDVRFEFDAEAQPGANFGPC